MTADVSRRMALLTGGAAIIAMSALAAGCGSSTKEAPGTQPPSGSVTESEAPAPSATEKKVSPLTPGGANSFTPSVNPKPPGPTCTQIVGNTCVR
ncbi:MAG: hypothetical protein WCH82_15515 [Mycobacteriaceae bacterium]